MLEEKKAYQILRNFGINHIIEFSQDGSDLSHPVSTVVEKENGIALWETVNAMNPNSHYPPTFDPSFVAANDDWFQKLIRFILLVSLLDGGYGILRFFTFALNQTIGSDLDPLPSLIAIHGIVSADDSDKLSNLLLLDEVEEFLRILGGGTGGSVTTIAEEMDINVWDFEPFRGLEKRKEVVDMGMDTSVRDLETISSRLHLDDLIVWSYQSEKMQSTIAVFCAFEAFHNRGVLVEFLLLNGHIYSNDILPDDTSSTDIQMSVEEPMFTGNFC